MTGQIKSVRYNVMDIGSVSGFMSVTGGLRNQCKDVYFIRVQGYSGELLKDIQAMDERLTERMNSGAGVYRRLSGLLPLRDFDDAGYYAGCYEKWVRDGRKRICTKSCTEAFEALAEMLSEACKKVVSVYGKDDGLSVSMEKNLVVKLLFWFDQAADGWLSQWDARKSVKIAADNITKKQEYFFFYFLTLLGWDVLLIQSRGDIDSDTDRLGLSKKLAVGAFDSAGSIPPFAKKAPSEPAEPSGEGTESTQNSSVIRMSIPARRPSERTGRMKPEAHAGDSAQTQTVRPEPVRSGQPSAVRQQGQERREKSYEELALLAASVVMIAVHDRKGDIVSTGSGIMIGKGGYILTNNHVASGGMFYSVKIEDDDRIYETREVIKYHSVLDLALIRIERQLNPIPVYRGSQKLVRGQRVVAIGSPLGLFNSVSDGIVSGFRMINGVNMIQFTAPTSHGSSGGAVLNMYGEVIGISTAGIDQGQNLNLAVGYEDIGNFIRGFV